MNLPFVALQLSGSFETYSQSTADEAHYLFNGSLTFCPSSGNFRRVAQYGTTVSAFSYPIYVCTILFLSFMSRLAQAQGGTPKKKNKRQKQILISST